MTKTGVQIEEALTLSGVRFGIVGQSETESDQADGAMRDDISCDGERYRRPIGFGQHPVEHGHEVGGRIGQSTVEIEQDGSAGQRASARLAEAR